MNNSGYCSLIITGESLNFDEIEKKLNMKASQKTQKDDFINNVIGKSQFDLIRFNKKMNDEIIPNETLNDLLDTIFFQKKFIKKLRASCNIYLKCYVQSDYAEVNYRITSDTMKKIFKLNIDLEISVLSWGGAE